MLSLLAGVASQVECISAEGNRLLVSNHCYEFFGHQYVLHVAAHEEDGFNAQVCGVLASNWTSWPPVAWQKVFDQSIFAVTVLLLDGTRF